MNELCRKFVSLALKAALVSVPICAYMYACVCSGWVYVCVVAAALTKKITFKFLSWRIGISVYNNLDFFHQKAENGGINF